MKTTVTILVFLWVLASAAFADIRPPQPKPTPAPADATEVGVSMSVSRWEKEGTLVISKSGLEKLNAAAKAKWGEKAVAAVEAPSRFSAQTLVGGLFISLAFVFGGIFLARSKGQISKTTVAVLLLAMAGISATIVTGNVPPPKRIGLDSGIINAVKMNDSVAVGKMKLLLVDYESREDVMLVLGNKGAGAGESEE